MKKISLALFIGLLMLSLVMVSAVAENTENAPVLGPGGENPNSESDTPILGPDGINKQEYPDDIIIGPDGINRSEYPIVGPDGINKQEYPDIIIDPAIHVYMYVRTNNGGRLNVRAWPDTNATVLDKLSYGDRVLVTGFAENRTWAKILYDNSDAYVLARYLTENDPGPRPQPTATPYYPPYPTPEPYYPPYPTQAPYVPVYPETTISQLNSQFTTMVVTGNQSFVVNTHPSRIGGYVPLYWAPDNGSAVQRYCYEGESFVVLAYNNMWLQVRDNASGFTGYLMRTFAY